MLVELHLAIILGTKWVPILAWFSNGEYRILTRWESIFLWKKKKLCKSQLCVFWPKVPKRISANSLVISMMCHLDFLLKLQYFPGANWRCVKTNMYTLILYFDTEIKYTWISKIIKMTYHCFTKSLVYSIVINSNLLKSIFWNCDLYFISSFAHGLRRFPIVPYLTARCSSIDTSLH